MRTVGLLKKSSPYSLSPKPSLRVSDPDFVGMFAQGTQKLWCRHLACINDCRHTVYLQAGSPHHNVVSQEEWSNEAISQTLSRCTRGDCHAFGVVACNDATDASPPEEPSLAEFMQAIILESAVERGAIAQLIGSPALAQKPQLTHRVSPRFCTNAFNPSRQRRRCSQVHIHAQLPNLG